MRKFLTAFFALFLLASLSFAADVTFMADGKVHEVVAADGDKAVAPHDTPQKRGHLFTGWHRDAAAKTVFRFAKESVKSNTTLYAGWEKEVYRVDFASHGRVVQHAVAPYDTVIKEPGLIPAETGLTFVGWFKDPIGVNRWDFAKDRVVTDTTVHAIWAPKTGTEGSIGVTTLRNTPRKAYFDLSELGKVSAGNAGRNVKAAVSGNIMTVEVTNPTGEFVDIPLTVGGQKKSFRLNLNYAEKGTRADPYYVTDQASLNNVRNDLGASYLVTNSFSLTGVWTPIGDNSTPFTGEFDGAGYPIYGLSITEPATATPTENYGLFGVVEGGSITGVFLHGNISLGTGTVPRNNVGLLVGLAIDASIINNRTSGTVSGTKKVGGMAGWINSNSTFSSNDSSAYVSTRTVSETDDGYDELVGGLVGQAGGIVDNVSDPTSPIIKSYATGRVSAEGDAVGGLAGEINAPSYSNRATGSVKGRGFVGGLIGSAYAEVSDSHAMGPTASTSDNVTASGAAGGLLGGARNGGYARFSFSAVPKITGFEAGGLIGRTSGRSNGYAVCNAALGNNVTADNWNPYRPMEKAMIYRVLNGTQTTAATASNYAYSRMILTSDLAPDQWEILSDNVSAGAPVSKTGAVFNTNLAGCGFNQGATQYWNMPSGTEIYPTLINAGADF